MWGLLGKISDDGQQALDILDLFTVCDLRCCCAVDGETAAAPSSNLDMLAAGKSSASESLLGVCVCSTSLHLAWVRWSSDWGFALGHPR